MTSTTEFDDLLGLDEPEHSEFSGVPAVSSIVGQDASLTVMTDNNLMMEFIDQMRRVPTEMVNDAIIGHGYALVLWKFREAAVLGDIDRTRSLKMWLDWAQPHIDKPKGDGERINNPGSAAFLPRAVK